jgi:uncharacterized protein (TIGR02246 family)
MKTPATVLLAATISLSSPAASARADDGTPAAAIREHVERFVSAWNVHDMTALARLFAVDADFVNVVGIWWTNRSEIRGAHEATHRTLFKDSTLAGRVASVKLIRPDVAVAHLAWSLVGARAPDGQAIPERTGILVFLLSKEAGGWTIRAAQNTDIVQGVLAPPVPRK